MATSQPQVARKPAHGAAAGLGILGKPKKFKRPVRWLLGPQLIAGLRGIVLYSAFGSKTDPKGWMRADPPEELDFSHEDKDGEFWFDYIADTGDGQKATYSIAYLLMSDLGIPEGENEVVVNPAPDEDLEERLPRGRFLFVGGDTAYHVGDYATLANRFQGPFEWAFQDLEAGGTLPERLPIFGIPGNHDYYDSLHGFNRQFRAPALKIQHAAKTLSGDPTATRDRPPQLELSGFERRQQATYMALKLPFAWHFWGVDAQVGKVDFRQAHFFRSVGGGSTPEKLILATPEPSVVFGKRPFCDSPEAQPCATLDLARPFVDPNGRASKKKSKTMSEDPAREDDGVQLPEGTCRLDIAGDVHHYARFWGPSSNGSGGPKQPRAHNYASVVAGFGGAFLHPSNTDFGEIEEQALFPPKSDSRWETTRRLLKPWTIIDGGYVWLIGALVAFSIVFAATWTESTKALVDGLFRGTIASLGKAWWNEITDAVGELWDGNLPVLENLDHGLVYTVALLLSLVVAAVLLWLGSKYSDKLVERARTESINLGHQLRIWAYYGGGALLAFASVWIFGNYRASYVLSDLIFLAIVVGLSWGLVWKFAVKTAAKRHSPKVEKTGFFLIGVLHAVLQLLLPVLIIIKNGWWSALGAVVLAALFVPIGLLVARWANRWALLLTWVVHASLQLYLPFALDRVPMGDLAGVLIALPLGAFMSCMWLGWYLAVTLQFNGHNNEAGGAARIEKFRGLVRIRLKGDELTAFVIAFDEPATHGKHLKPKVVDKFTLRLTPEPTLEPAAADA